MESGVKLTKKEVEGEESLISEVVPRMMGVFPKQIVVMNFLSLNCTLANVKQTARSLLQ